jgi:hypothetical protein
MLDHLGNEFMVWLWHALQNDSDTVQLADGSEVAVMLTKTLTLDCPRGETGRDSLTDDAPTRLPEAFRALQSGKLPRKAGLILVRHGAQYELTLQAETLAVSGALIPKPEDGELAASEVRVARIDSLRHLTETLDLLFDAYRRRRAGSGWAQEVSRIRRMAGRTRGRIQVPPHCRPADFRAAPAGDFVRLHLADSDSGDFADLSADAQLSARTRMVPEVERRNLDLQPAPPYLDHCPAQRRRGKSLGTLQRCINQRLGWR